MELGRLEMGGGKMKPRCENCEYFMYEDDLKSWCLLTCENTTEDGKCEEWEKREQEGSADNDE